uniref:Uncharacterized protein n=1 Tax=Glossina pallidipes TaxID=7398 RepID=A0A1A9Z3M9_GLOPL
MSYGNSWTAKAEITKYWTFTRLEDLLETARIYERQILSSPLAFTSTPFRELLLCRKWQIVNKTERFPQDGLYVIISHGTIAQLYDNVVVPGIGLRDKDVDENLRRHQTEIFKECYRHLRTLTATLVTPPPPETDNFIFSRESFEKFYGLQWTEKNISQ